MITITAFETHVCYYPLGNTSPVLLTQDLPPEQDADILLLGCGDARNILFSCFIDNARRMDVTCCDIEPGIQARNVLLYSLLIDDEANLNIDRIWNIYYHWSLDEDSVELLETQIEKLLQYSKSIDEWHNSVYGSTIRFCDEISLSRVKSYWSNFSSRGLTPARNEERLRQLKDAHARAKSLRTEFLEGGITLNDFRSTLPAAYAEAPKDFSEIAVHWWTHGTLPLRSGLTSNSIHLNPSFFYSPNSALTLHFGISPLSGFPLSIANTPIKKTCPLSIEKNGLSSKDRLVASAKRLFSSWVSAFRRVAGKKLLIRIFCGDAVHFCFTLASECDKDSPTRFDCIDTSNLGDPLGPLNLLTLGSVLLKKHPSSSLYTEMLVQHYSNVKDRLTESMGCDARTVALLLGLVCPDLFTNATNCVEEDSLNIKRLQMKTGRGVSQERSRFRWKRINSDSSEAAYVYAEAETLAKFFIQIYYEMFRYENLMKTFSKAETVFKKFLVNSSNPRYNRSSFAFLLSIVKSNVSTDWDKCVKLICDEVFRSKDDLFGSINASVELLLHMHFFGVDCSGALKLEPKDLSSDLIARALNLNEKSPDTLCVTLRVPRENLKVLTSQRCSPVIVCSITGKDPRGSQWESYFSSIHVAFGEWSERNDKNSSYPCFVEDPRRQSGTSDMFASFFAPTKLLLKSKQSVPVVRCQLLRTCVNLKFIDELGFDLCLVRKEITSNDVSITQFVPGTSALPSYLPLNLSRKTASDLVTLRFSDDSAKIKTLVKRINLQSDAAKVLAVKSSAVKIEFKSPLLAIVTVANSFKFEFRFPFPVSVSSKNYKVRFGRTSSFIEVESPLLDPLEEDIASFMFPTFLTNATSDVTIPTSWIATYIDMDAMPQIDTTNTQKLEWLNNHLCSMFSKREQSSSVSGTSDTRTEFKRSLFSVFAEFTGSLGKKGNILGLKKKDSPVETIIIPSCLRLDLVNHSVVLDCAILPQNHDKYKDNLLGMFLLKITPSGSVLEISEAENRAWKALMPAFTERCRTNTWTHGPNCEYVKEGEIPLAAALIQSNVSPICTCGVGKFPAQGYLDKLKEKYPELNYVLKRYATRAAIAPVFSVPYVEEDFFADIGSIIKSMGTIDKCQSCGSNKRKNDEEKQNSLLTCARCKFVKYCSADCQKADWKRHKLSCGKYCRMLKDSGLILNPQI